MFQAIVERLLNKILGEYIENFSAENLKIGLWSGEVVISNVKLKKQIIKKLNLPFILLYSRIGCLKMNIPWKSLTSSKIDIVLDGLEIIIAELPHSEWDCKNTKIIQKRKEEIVSYCEAIINDFAKKAEKTAKQSEEGYFSKLIVKIIDNLQVTIKDIHVRYEDQITNAYSFGVTLQELKVYTVNKNDQPQYIDRTKPEYLDEPLRKKLQLSNIGFYWNEKSEFFNEKQYQKKMKESIAKKNSTANLMSYIILLSSNAKLLLRQKGKQFKEAEIDLGVQFDELKLQITRRQLQQIISLGERLQKYSNEVRIQNRVMLTPEEIKSNKETFTRLFPSFYTNPKGMNATDMKMLEHILQKMEIQNFTPIMTKYLQDKEKERIIKEKKDKSKGWFTGPKQLTPQQLQEIQKYLNANFAQQVSLIKRPQDYFYISMNISLNKLQVTIANTEINLKEGISTAFEDIKMIFKLRENGYMLNFNMNDIKVDLFAEGKQREEKSVVRKFVRQRNSHNGQEYIRLIVNGNPLDKTYLNTEVILYTEELIVVFDPKIIDIAKTFADLQVSKQNTEAALQKYGEIKEKTSNAVNDSLKTQVKKQIGIDLNISAITVVLFFDPKKANENCWAISLGQITINTDQKTLRKQQITQSDPIQKYDINLSQIALKYFKTIDQFKESRRHPPHKHTHIDQTIVLDDLSISLSLMMYQQNTQSIPKLKIQMTLPELDINLSSFTYENLQKIDQCFAYQSHLEQYRMTTRAAQKADVMRNSQKLGVIYIKDTYSQQWNKYIAVLSQHYIYLFKDKKDTKYAYYYYTKKAEIEMLEGQAGQKPFLLRLSNKLNEQVFGFDKEQPMKEWYTLLKQPTVQHHSSSNKQIQQKPVPSKISPDILNVELGVSITSVSLSIFQGQSVESTIRVNLTKINLRVLLHQQKTRVFVVLKKLQINDSIRKYTMDSLSKLIFSGKEREIKESIESSVMEERLIDLEILQMSKKHPSYANVDTMINFQFGHLTINYKCETIKAILTFFVPPKDKSKQQNVPAHDSHHHIEVHDDHKEDAVSKAQTQTFKLKLNLKIKQIGIYLVNEKTKTIIAKMMIGSMNVIVGISLERLLIEGTLSTIELLDFSNYPKTIIQEQPSYPNYNHLIKNNAIKQNQQTSDEIMLKFKVQLLNNANQNGKKILVESSLSELKVYYTQQPVLRLITYMNTQMLRVFDVLGDTDKKDEPKKNDTESKDKKPQKSQISLAIKLQKIGVVISPTNEQHLQLTIPTITVSNQNIYREYTKSKKPIILVENYLISMQQMLIGLQFISPKTHQLQNYSITNKMNFTCSVDLIQGQAYYQHHLKDDFENGLRVKCQMSPFFLRMNHEQYNFIMKCLNWNITYNDNAEEYLYDISDKKEQNTNEESQSSFHLKVVLPSVSLFVTQNKLPIVFLLLESTQFEMDISDKYGTTMDLSIGDLYGTSLEHGIKDTSVIEKQETYCIESGMFNAVGYQHKWTNQTFTNINSLLALFDRKKSADKEKNSKFLIFRMATDVTRSTFIELRISELDLGLNLKLLLLLSRLAVIEEYIQPPKPLYLTKKQIEQQLTKEAVKLKKQKQNRSQRSESDDEGMKEEIKQEIEEEKQQKMQKIEQKHEKQEEKIVESKPEKQLNGKFQLFIQIKRIMTYIGDQKRKNFLVLQTGLQFQIFNVPQKSQEEIISICTSLTQDKYILHSNLTLKIPKISLYFCEFAQSQTINRRDILSPLPLSVNIRKNYENRNGAIILKTQIDGDIGKLVVEVTVKDIIKVQLIATSNLQIYNKFEDEVKKQKQQFNESQKVIHQQKMVKQKQQNMKKQQQQVIKDVKQQIKQKITPRLNARVHLSAMRLLLINDCNSNFIPLLQAILQDTTVLYDSFLIKSAHLSLQLVLALRFFNPRSSRWEPIVEGYGVTFDYLGLITQNGLNKKIMIDGGTIEGVQSLNINISTQLIASIKATMEIGKKQKDLLEQAEQIAQIEISPFIFENITNTTIFIERILPPSMNKQLYPLPPLHRGPVRLQQDSEMLTFLINNSTHKIGLQHYGILRVTESYFIEFKVEQLNRIIRFISRVVIKNGLSAPLVMKRKILAENRQQESATQSKIKLTKSNMKKEESKIEITNKQENKIVNKDEVVEEIINFGVGCELPLDYVTTFQVSLNKKSYTQPIEPSNPKLKSGEFIGSAHSSFHLLLQSAPKYKTNSHLTILAPFIVHNCLPLPIVLQFILKGKTVKTKNIQAQSSNQVYANEDIEKFEFKLSSEGFEWSGKFALTTQTFNKEGYIEVPDEDDCKTTLKFIFTKTADLPQYILTIYCKSFILSQLPTKLLAYTLNKQTNHVQLIGGQRTKCPEHNPHIILLGEQSTNEIRLAGEGCLADFSTPVDITAVGNNSSARIVLDIGGKKMFTVLGVEITARRMHKSDPIFCKQIVIRAKSVVVNQTKQRFYIEEESSLTHQFVIQPNQRKPFYFTTPEMKNRPQKLYLRTPQTHRSIALSSHFLGNIFFKLQPLVKVSQHQDEQPQPFYYKISVKQVDQYLFYQIFNVSPAQIPYEIEVRSQRISVVVPHTNIKITKGHPYLFINSNQEQPIHEVNVQIYHSLSTYVQQVKIFPDDLNFKSKVTFPLTETALQGQVSVDLWIRFNDNKKFVIIDEALGKTGIQPEYDTAMTICRIQRVVISFIQNHKTIDKPYESLTFTMENLFGVVRQTNKITEYQLKLNFLQFDQSQPYNLPNPVILTPAKYLQFTREKQPKAIFNIHIQQNKEFIQNTFIDKLQVNIEDFVVQISEYFITIMLKMIKQFNEVMDEKDESILLQRKGDGWKDVAIPPNGKKIFIKSIKLSPFVIEISAQLKLNQLDAESNQFFGTFLSAFGFIVSNIEAAPIYLSGIELSDCIDTLSGINQKLILHYKTHFIKQLYKVFGSLNIIGNPLGLWRTISTGMKDLKDKPQQGLVKGPLEFGKGIAEGGASLVAHSIGGAFNSVSKVTGTVSTGLAALAFDKQFEEHRQKQKMRKPQHVLQGISKGGQAVFYGFKEGITGVFLKPYQNAKQQGAKGFFKGAAQGLAGLVVKPVTGIIDFASKTTQGIKNTALYFQDKPNQHRIRYPRVFYTQCFIVKEYDQIDAKIYSVMKGNQAGQSKYEDCHYVQRFRIENEEPNAQFKGQYLVVLQEFVVAVNIVKNKILWSFDIMEISIQNIESKESVLIIAKNTSMFKKSEHILRIQTAEKRQNVVTLVQSIQKQKF